MIVVPEEEETEEDSKPSEQFEPVELNGVWLTFIIKKLNGYLMSDFNLFCIMYEMFMGFKSIC